MEWVAAAVILFILAKAQKIQPGTTATILQFPVSPRNMPSNPPGQTGNLVLGTPEPIGVGINGGIEAGGIPFQNPDTRPGAWPGLNPGPVTLVSSGPVITSPPMVASGLPGTAPVTMLPVSQANALPQNASFQNLSFFDLTSI